MKITGYVTRCPYAADWVVTPYVRDISDRVAGMAQPVCSVHLMAITVEMMNDGLKRFAGFVVQRQDTVSNAAAIGARPAIRSGEDR